MGKIAIVTDTNSGIGQKRAKELGVYVLPMPFFVNGNMHFEGVDFTQEEFYQKLEEDADVSTSMPSPGDVMDIWDKALEENEFVVHIPMSSGLSASCEAATALAENDYKGRVFVVNNQRISVSLSQSIEEAVALREAGKTAAEMKEILEAHGRESFIYISVDTLKYLKKGGRVSPAAAAIGTVLNIKPVLVYRGDKIEPFEKARGTKASKKAILKVVEKEMKEKFGDDPAKTTLAVAHTCTDEEGEAWRDEVLAHFPQFAKEDINMDKLSLSIACHTGPGVLALACSRKLEV
jgi:DegV family protein with EDD domain